MADLLVRGCIEVEEREETGYQLATTITDRDGNPVGDAQAHWATLDAGMATLDGSGLVTVVSAGSAQIVATFAGVGDAANVAVEATS